MNAGTDFHQIAEVLGVGVTYSIDIDLSVGSDRRAYRVTANGSSQGTRLTFVEAIDWVRDLVAADLEANGCEAGR